MSGRRSSKAEYYHKRRADPDEFVKKSFKTVPQSHVSTLRKKYKKGTKVVVGKRKKSKNWGVQSVLVHKK